jgi:hypothetical protein
VPYIVTLQTFDNPCKMSEWKRVKSDDSTSSLSTLDRKRIFDQIYKGDPLLDADIDLFKKDSKELAEDTDSKKYTLYFSALKQAESEAEIAKIKAESNAEMAKIEAQMAKMKIESEAELAKIEAQMAKMKIENEAQMAKIFTEQSTRNIAEATVASRVLEEFPKALLKKVCNELGPLLFDIAYKYKELTNEKKTEIATKIQTILIDDTENCTKLLQSLSLGQSVNPIHVTTGQSQIPPYDSFSIKIMEMNTSAANEVGTNEFESKMAALEMKRKSEKAAEDYFFYKAGNEFPYSLLKKVCNELGPLLFDFAFTENELTNEKKTEIATKIQTILINDTENCTKLLDILRLGHPSHDSFSIKIAAMDTSEEVRDAFRFYTEIAKSTDIEESVFKTLYTEIFSTTDKFYSEGIIPNRIRISSFCSIVGPSLMGKTQFAFSLARYFLVFYVNFSSILAMQDIYRAFEKISSVFISCLHEDVEILENRKIELDSDQISEHPRTIKLKTIGFLWEFVKISTEFDSNASDWFEFYLKSRTIELKAMSLSDYLENLSNLSY